MAQQLHEEGVQLGWETRLVPFGDDVTACVHALGFATRAALSFGGGKPGDYRKILNYNKNRVFAFVLALGPVDDEKHAQAAGAINFGFPTISETDIDQILPSGICMYEHVVSPVSYDVMVDKGMQGQDHEGPNPRPVRSGVRGGAHSQGRHACRIRRQRHPCVRVCHDDGSQPDQ